MEKRTPERLSTCLLWRQSHNSITPGSVTTPSPSVSPSLLGHTQPQKSFKCYRSQQMLLADFPDVKIWPLSQAILQQVKMFVREFAAGGPAAPGAAQLSPAAKQPVESTSPAAADISQLQKQEKKAAKPAASKSRSNFESTEKFYAGAKDIYNCFTDSKCISAYTQSPSTVLHCTVATFRCPTGDSTLLTRGWMLSSTLPPHCLPNSRTAFSFCSFIHLVYGLRFSDKMEHNDVHRAWRGQTFAGCAGMLAT